MACEPWREMLSARLDGEDDPAGRARVDEHLAGCAGCREWLDRAVAVNRLTRTGIAASVPDLSAAILAALPARPVQAARWSLGRLAGQPVQVAGWSRARLATALFVALAAIGAVQLILGLAQISAGGTDAGGLGGHVHAGAAATPGHLWHESAAWNVAVGAGYLFLALRRSRPTGLVPMLTAFVGTLLLLSVNDLTAGRVDGTRLVSHGFVILGYLLVVVLSRVTGESAQPPGARGDGGSGWRAQFDRDAGAEPAPSAPVLRLVPRGAITAQRDRRAA
jgi:predicted anti-sigma-YlaC factor YlaD